MTMQITSNGPRVSGSTNLDLTQLDKLATVTVAVSSLLLDKSPRQGGDNDEHVRVLAESEDPLPPIVVHGQSMRVIDGIHRVRAAIMRGAKSIDAKIYHGTDDDAFVLAVRLNIAHGLPLTRAERNAATLQIIASHPQWSDRMIATVVGLSAGTVAKVRRRSTAQNEQSSMRIGKDGRVRPVNGAEGRLKAAQLLTEKPSSSIRAIANVAGVSSSTVHDVQRRLRAGQHPIPVHHSAPEPPAMPGLPGVSPSRGVHGHPEPADGIDVAAILGALKRDPSLRRSDPTKFLLRCLDRYRVGVEGSGKIVEVAPDHCAHLVAKLARAYARVWIEIATQLEQRCLQVPVTISRTPKP